MAISAIEGRLSRRTRLLLATSMTAMALGSASTQANEWTLSGFPTVDVGAGNPVFGVVAGNIDLDVKIDTPTATLLTGVFTASLNGEVTTTVSQEIDAAFWGIYQSNLAADMTIDGTGGSIIANEGIATFSQGTTKIDGFTSITTDAFRGIVSNFGWVGAGAVEIGQATRIGTITAATNGIEAYSTGANAIAIDASTINAGSGAAWWGIYAAAIGTGDVTTNNTGEVSGLIAIEARSLGGNLDVSGTGGGSLLAAGSGVVAGTIGAGTVDVYDFSSITGTANYGVLVGAGTGTTNIVDNGDIKSVIGTSVVSLGGDVTVKDNGNITGTATGNLINSGGGNIVTDDNGDIEGTTTVGNWLFSVGGDISINGNGKITGGTEGIAADALGGTVNVGTAAYNGEIIGGADGIEIYSAGGTINVKTNKNVTGTVGYGEYLSAGTGNINVDVDAAKVEGLIDGISVISTGINTVDVAAGALVQGQSYGMTVSGTSTTTNLGTIKDTTDTGAAGDIGGDAYWSFQGAGTLNNEAGGIITGRVHSNFSTSFTMNNKTGAVWNAGALANGFGAPGDTVNNAGLINIRNGLTGFTALDTLNNQSGGVIDMQYGPGADDDLNGILTFASLGGSTLKMDVDFAGVRQGNDFSSYGTGSADTIYAINGAPVGATTMDLNFINRATQNALIGTSGSLALVDTGALGDLVDPGLGGLPNLLASDNYFFLADPSSGAVKFVLQEDDAGGVYLRWAPNITANSLGGFTGGNPAGGGGVSADAASGQAIAGAGGASAGISGGIGGGPGGGGVAGGVADSAAANAQSNRDCHVGKDLSSDTYSSSNYAWMSGTGSKSKFDGGGKASDIGGAIGVEHDLAGLMGLGCGDVKIGVFGHMGEFSSAHATGTADGSAKGLGAYIEAASESGLYLSVLGATSWSETDLSNAVFGSTAKQDAVSYVGTAAVGYTTEVAEKVWLDARAFASIAHNDGDGFTDSAGIVVDYTKSDVRTFGLMTGFNTELGDGISAFARGGVKWVSMDSQSSAFGIKIDGEAKVFVKSLEAGLSANLGDNVTLSASAFSDFTKASTTYGGELALKFKF